jgi:hypothetical protein
MWKNIKFFWFYRKTIKSLKFELEQKFNVRIDKASRLYTVVNIPEDIVGEAYSLKKSDIDRISENYVRQFYVELGNFLNKSNLQEMFEVYEIKKVDKYSYLLISGFSLFKSQRYYNTIYYIVTPIILLTSIIISTILLF